MLLVYFRFTVLSMKRYQYFQSTILLCFFLVITKTIVNAQQPSTCPNSNFNLGNFTDWEEYYGDVLFPAHYQGLSPGRHTIIRAPGSNDPRTCGGLLTIPPGESFSAKLGNENIDSEAEQLRYTISVNSTTNLFIYKYAVVLQDPGHLPEEQPSFTIEVADNTGTVIDPVCGYYYVYAQQGLPTWHSCPDDEVIWKDWTTVGIDLTPYIGQTVSIVFTTRDCSLGGHYGYSYISAYCSKLQIMFGYCPNDTIATVTAPPGFSYKWANGAASQTTTIHNPYYGMIASCELTSANGCKVTIDGIFKPTIVDAAFNCRSMCEREVVQFTDSTTINQNLITNWVWDFGDCTPILSNIQNPQHIYDTTGTFKIRMIAYSTDGCPDTLTKLLDIVPVPVADFTANTNCSVRTTIDTIFFQDQVRLSVPPGCDNYSWNTGEIDNTIMVTNEGWYKVTIENADLCFTTDSVMMLYCYVPLSMPNAFSPNNDGLNDCFRPVTFPEKVTSFKMDIFDNWGRRVYEADDIRQGWDGTINGRPAPLGFYVYSLIYGNPSGEENKLTGSVTLLR
jgi:gliding motility-associated-like protein